MTSITGATPPPAVAAPDYYVNSWAGRTSQRLAGRIIDSMIAFGCIVATIVLGPQGRPLAQDLLIVALVSAVETISITRSGATLGMHVVDLRVAVVGRAGRPDWLTALRRSVPVALCYVILLPGTFVVFVMPFALLISIGLSPLRRGFHDRSSGTVVVQQGAPRLITEDHLAGWWQPDQSVVLSPWGRVPDLYDRRRARAHRFDDAWWLAASIMAATIASVGMRDVPMLWLWSTLVWLVVVSVDETWWVATRGATPGHLHAGYRVVDLETGATPSRRRAIVRAVVLAPLLYVPPLQLLLALWVRSSSLHRGPHDLAARTIVVEPGYVPREFAPAPVPQPRPPVVAQPGWYPPAGPWTPALPPPPVLPWNPPPPNVPGPF